MDLSPTKKNYIYRKSSHLDGGYINLQIGGLWCDDVWYI